MAAALYDGKTGTGSERRMALRRNVVDRHLITVDLGFQTGALLLDVSAGGIGVQALARAPIGATTDLHFELPGSGARVDAIGTVAWTDSSGRLGIRFEEVAAMCRPHLAQWLSREPRPQLIASPRGGLRPIHNHDELAALRRDLLAQQLRGDGALAFIVERTLSATRATGAAIALERGGGIFCRAASGAAPEVGARLYPGAGLAGECVRSGEVVRCEDTETDPRADRFVCRRLGLRSAVILPIRTSTRVAGALAVFSSRPHAFQSHDVQLLRAIVELVAEIHASGHH